MTLTCTTPNAKLYNDMTLMETIKDIFGMTPKGPEYSLDDLIFHNAEYQSHVMAAYRQFDTMLCNEPWVLMMKDPGGVVKPVELLARVKWTYLGIIRGWVDDMFIPKIRDFTKRPHVWTGVNTKRIVCERDGDPLWNGRQHMLVSDHHAEELDKVLGFMLCDARSPFDDKRALDDGTWSLRERTQFYVIDGLWTIRRNVERIRKNLEAFIAFAEPYDRARR